MDLTMADWITKEEREALKEVRRALLHEAVAHVRAGDAYERPEFRGLRFNMRITCLSRECGTVACIGGWMALKMIHASPEKQELPYMDVVKAHDFVTDYVEGHYLKASPSLHDLFYPPGKSENEDWWDHITPSRAVLAITNFLDSGNPGWYQICKDIMPVEIYEARPR